MQHAGHPIRLQLRSCTTGAQQALTQLSARESMSKAGPVCRRCAQHRLPGLLPTTWTHEAAAFYRRPDVLPGARLCSVSAQLVSVQQLLNVMQTVLLDPIQKPTSPEIVECTMDHTTAYHTVQDHRCRDHRCVGPARGPRSLPSSPSSQASLMRCAPLANSALAANQHELVDFISSVLAQSLRGYYALDFGRPTAADSGRAG